MLLKNANRLSLLKQINQGLVGVALVVALLLGLGIYCTSKSEDEVLVSSKARDGVPAELPFTCDQISLFGSHDTIDLFPFPDLKDKLVFLGKNRRPDVPYHLQAMRLASTGPEETLIFPGQLLYLQFQQEGGSTALHLSEEPSPLWVRPLQEVNGSLVLEMGVKLARDNGEMIIDGVREIVLQERRDGEAYRAGSNRVKAIEEALVLGQDQVLRVYGGREFVKRREKCRLALPSQNKKLVYYISKGDYFVWDGQRWRLPKYEEETHKRPLALVKQASNESVVLELWDEEGLFAREIKFYPKQEAHIPFDAKNMFTRIRKRTRSKVSCLAGGKTRILKQGDWLLYNGTTWRNLSSWSDISRYLDHKTEGVLFVFDKLEERGKETFFVGTLFDKTRTYSQEVGIPLSVQKENKQISRKKTRNKLKSRY